MGSAVRSLKELFVGLGDKQALALTVELERQCRRLHSKREILKL